MPSGRTAQASFPFTDSALSNNSSLPSNSRFRDQSPDRLLICASDSASILSILASTWNEHVLDNKRLPLQDTNDRFLANIQRDGTYSVVPRVPGGEITPDQLIALGRAAKKFGLYSTEGWCC